MARYGNGKTILCLNTHGQGGQDEARMRCLTQTLPAEIVFHHINRPRSYGQALREARQVIAARRWDLVYQEGTGISGGLPLIQSARTRGQRFLVSSGDSVGGFFRGTRGPAAGALAGVYERLLYRACAGYVGWTPYLTGAALLLGARRAVTVEGGVDLDRFRPFAPAARQAARARWGLPMEHLVCGIAGSLVWTARQRYCYGLELIQTLKRLRRPDVSVLVVGEGDGLARLRALVPEALRARVVFTGRLAEADLVAALNAMDIGFVPQTLDALGSYRLTTKLPEYLACGLPVAMSPVPGFYDYVGAAGWPLPLHPADPQFHARCAEWLDGLDAAEIARKAAGARAVAARRFDYACLRPRFGEFVQALLEEGDET